MTNLQMTKHLLDPRRIRLHPRLDSAGWQQSKNGCYDSKQNSHSWPRIYLVRQLGYISWRTLWGDWRGDCVHVRHDTGPNCYNSKDWSADSCLPAFSGIPPYDHVNAASCWPLIRVTIRHYYILHSWQRAMSLWLSICVPIDDPLSIAD